jgi:hypothetical protein
MCSSSRYWCGCVPWRDARAELLLRIRKHQKGVSLPRMSIRLSQMMIRAADIISAQLDSISTNDATLFRQLVTEHLPEVLPGHGR